MGACPWDRISNGLAHGDGRADLAVFRASTAQWFIFGTTAGLIGPVGFGAPGLGDIPVNRPAALR